MKKILYINLVLVVIMIFSSIYVSAITPTEGEIISRTWLKATYSLNGDLMTVYYNLPALIMLIALFTNMYFVFRHAYTGMQE